MNKIWIIHNSLHGNSKQISEKIAGYLKEDNEIQVESIKSINPKTIAQEEPYGLIVAVRILAFRSDPEMLAFLKNLDKVITKPFSKVAYFATHALGWKKFFIKGMKKTLEKIGCVEEVCPEYLEIRLESAEGPIPESADAKVESYITTLKEFMK